MSTPAEYLSQISANALISDLRPTTLSLPALQCLNSFLDEILVSIIISAESLNPSDLRKEGIPNVFSSSNGSTGGENTNLRSLGRSAIAEAELELRSWLEGKNSIKGFKPNGQGNGMINDKTNFNNEKAINLMRFKCVSYSTLASQDNLNEILEEEVLTAWKNVGGDSSEDTVEPAALWITAIIEHVCEHVLTQLASVVARDSEIIVAGPQELYTALCEDESIWGLFKKMKVKDQLEAVIRAGTRHKRSTPSRPSTSQSAGGRASPSMMSGSPHASKISLGHHRDSSIEATRNITSSPPQPDRSSFETNRFGGIAGGVMRKGSQFSKKSTNSPGSKHHLLRGQGHERSGSVLSDNTKSMLGAFHDRHESDATEEDEQSIQEAQDEFDALVRSGETMKVSLTPSRLKNFEGGANRRRTAESPVPSLSARSARSDNITPSQFPSPPSTEPRSTTIGQSDQYSTSHSSPTQLSSSTLASRPLADSPQRRLQARAATTIEEKADEEEKADMSKKESLMELLTSEGALESQSPTKKSGLISSNRDQIRRNVPAVVLGTPPPPPPESTFSSPSNRELDTPKAGDHAIHQPDIISSPTNAHDQSPFSPQPVLTRSQYSSSSLNRPNGKPKTPPMGGAEEDYTFPGPGQRNTKKKSEAQELADFFNNTPPPTSEPTFKSQPQSPDLDQGEGFSDPPQTAKPGKGFRALLSKATKSSKKEKEKSPQLGTSASYSKLNSSSDINVTKKSESGNAISKHRHNGSTGKSEGPKITGWAGFEDPNSQPQLGKNGGMTMPKKQKSLHSLSTVPTAFRPFAREDDYNNAQGRKGSNASRTSEYAKEAAAKYAERRNSAVDVNGRRGSAGIIAGDRRGSATASTLGLGDRRGSESTLGAGERRGSATTPTVNERRGSQPLYPSTTDNDSPIIENKKMIGLGIGAISSKTAIENGSIEKGEPPILGKTISSSASSFKRPNLEGINIPGSANSFQTAHSFLSPPSSTMTTIINEPNSSNQIQIENTNSSERITNLMNSNSTSTTKEDINIPISNKSLINDDDNNNNISNIPINDLIPLRKLLNHATTVIECKLLLDAILTQFGVPKFIEKEEEGEIEIKPEDRVLAWLLAGREGPN
ncbi:uncharacterized protein I206_103425 [Kwoniella pini CBS 10737]|uniref:Uncharacterized protein n=1 Tax=Kwoniella pini CBS 10737 TaxID=1296096 RepID=A0A1B9IA09_9TREE|nr:uncharacterized protein I206_01571 [Kwoniella pini CBS 10737]OCF52284.1 hypothetical protein I206_01571 [Kwoniella pini CBS 10737]